MEIKNKELKEKVKIRGKKKVRKIFFNPLILSK